VAELLIVLVGLFESVMMNVIGGGELCLKVICGGELLARQYSDFAKEAR
jgi:hypothetical protein